MNWVKSVVQKKQHNLIIDFHFQDKRTGRILSHSLRMMFGRTFNLFLSDATSYQLDIPFNSFSSLLKESQGRARPKFIRHDFYLNSIFSDEDWRLLLFYWNRMSWGFVSQFDFGFLHDLLPVLPLFFLPVLLPVLLSADFKACFCLAVSFSLLFSLLRVIRELDFGLLYSFLSWIQIEMPFVNLNLMWIPNEREESEPKPSHVD